MRQPVDVQDTIMGSASAGKIRNGTIKRDQFSAAMAFRPLTLEQFRRAIKSILSTGGGVTN